MNREFDCRVLLANIPDTLSEDERRRFGFVIGNIVSRVDRDNTTLGSTLNMIESLFQQEIITEDNLDFLIQVFDAINVKTAVSRLQAFQTSRQPCRERQLSVPQIINDNEDDDDDQIDKQITFAHTSLLPVHRNSIVETKATTTNSSLVSSETSTTSNRIPKQTKFKLLHKFSKSSLSSCLFILILFNILSLLICSSIIFSKRIRSINMKKQFHPDVYHIRHMTLCTNITDGKRINHARDLSLSFHNPLQSIELITAEKLLCSMTFIYSKKQSIKHDFNSNCESYSQQILSFKNAQEIVEVIQYFDANNVRSSHIIGIAFGTIQDPLVTYGSSLNDSCRYHGEGYTLGYVLAIETHHYLHGFDFILYRIRPSNSQIEGSIILLGFPEK